MIVAQVGSTLYDVVLLLHLLFIIVGFGSSFVWPALASRARKLDPPTGYAMNREALAVGKILTSPFIWLAGLFGIVLIQLSDGVFTHSQTWISIAYLLFIVAAALATFVHAPNLMAMNELSRQLVEGEAAPAGDGPPPQVAELEARGKRAAMIGGILHLLFLALMIDMIFKPGL